MTEKQRSKIMELVESISEAQAASYETNTELAEAKNALDIYLEELQKESESEKVYVSRKA